MEHRHLLLLCFGHLASYIQYQYIAQFLRQYCRSMTFRGRWGGSVPLFHGSGIGSGSGSCSLHQLLSSCQQKQVFSSKFFCLLLWNWRYIYISVKCYKVIKEANPTGPGRRELTKSKQQPPAAAWVEGDRKPQNNSDPRVHNLRRFFGLQPRVYTSFYPRYSTGRAFSISWSNLQFLRVIAL